MKKILLVIVPLYLVVMCVVITTLLFSLLTISKVRAETKDIHAEILSTQHEWMSLANSCFVLGRRYQWLTDHDMVAPRPLPFYEKTCFVSAENKGDQLKWGNQ